MHEKCSSMSIKELVRATSTDKSHYEPEFLQIAKAELDRQWAKVAEFRNSVRVRLNNQHEEILTLEEGLSKLREKIGLWDAWIFTNCIDDVLILQQELTAWSGRFIEENQYQSSFWADSIEDLHQILSLFLALDDWHSLVRDEFTIHDWSILAESDSADYARAVIERLARENVKSTVKKRIMGNLFRDEAETSGGISYIVLAPSTAAEISQAILEEIQEMIENLHEQAAQYSARGESPSELEIYERILKLVPDDQIALFNKGAILYEMEQYEDAAECFIKQSTGAGHETGDVEEYLQEILHKLPDHKPILHTMATLAQLRGDTEQAKGHLEQILAVDTTDPVAHVNLGHLYFADSSDDRRALQHFDEYLKLNPQADDRSTIEEIIRTLR